ncbi:MAG: non-ribosomal peptide synthetase, partial [Prolixibacteraceae bacterium]|nr:non-ribosomal peptide synthetase [Prolixibacteraceae bacterium]
LITNLNILPQSDKDKLTKWNLTDACYEDSLCLHQKFENQVKMTPDNTALIYYDKTLTYNELNIHANRLAHFLIDNGLEIEDKVGISLDRSLEMIIAILATLKAGGAYVPIDTHAPEERNRILSEDAGLKFILTTQNSAVNSGSLSGIINLDDILKTNISEKTSNPSTGVHSRNLAYLIYTSGSTGRPKGVMIEHRSVMNKIGWIQKNYPLQKGEVLVQKTPATFDVSVWELFWWFFNGGKLDLLKPEGEKEPKEIVKRIKTSDPALLIFVPSVFSLFLDYLTATGQEHCLQNIRWIILIGEALPTTLVNRYNKIYQDKKSPQLINTYGPTEATVAVSWYECPVTENTGKIYIGKPIDNTKLFVINAEEQVQPVGVPGELVITGVNLARGYRNAPELTSQKFINLELPDGIITKAYKTGDMAKWDPSGELDFLGRIDNQVKIRGMRIEPGDIEAKLLEHPDINEAAVIVTKGNSENKILLGYIVSDKKLKGKISQVKEFLQKKLPPHMIPAQIIEIDKMPLTGSGKINRKQLPVPDFNSTVSFVMPSSQIESQLTEIWKELLNLEKISTSDNFFDLGGDSMLAVTMVTKIKQLLNLEVDVLKILEYPNISALAGFLSEKESDSNEILSNIEQRAMLRKNLNRARSRRFIL